MGRKNRYYRKSKAVNTGEASTQEAEEPGKEKGTAKVKNSRPPLTHFLCIPLVTETSKPQLRTSLASFKEDVLGAVRTEDDEKSQDGESLLSEKAIRPLGALHLTIGVMSLDQKKLECAIGLLQSLDLGKMLTDALDRQPQSGRQRNNNGQNGPSGEANEAEPSPESLNTNCTPSQAPLHTLNRPVSPPPVSTSTSQAVDPTLPLTISLQCLHSMHPAHKTSILYAGPVDATSRLLPFCERLKDLFTEQELLVPDDRKLKLHATIVNTIYAKGQNKGRKGGKEQHKPVSSESAEKDEHTPSDDSQKVESASTPTASEPTSQPQQITSNVKSTISSLIRKPPGLASPAASDAPQPTAPNKSSSGHGPNSRAPLRFNATSLLERYKDFTWASDFRIEEVAICKMGAKKILNEQGEVVDEAYEEIAHVDLPG